MIAIAASPIGRSLGLRAAVFPIGDVCWSASTRRWRQFGGAVAVVLGVDGDARRDEFIDAVEDVGAQGDVGPGQLRFELFHGAGTDDRRR